MHIHIKVLRTVFIYIHTIGSLQVLAVHALLQIHSQGMRLHCGFFPLPLQRRLEALIPYPCAIMVFLQLLGKRHPHFSHECVSKHKSLCQIKRFCNNFLSALKCARYMVHDKLHHSGDMWGVERREK